LRNSIIALGIALLAGVALAGCGSKTSVFHSPDNKYMVTCSGEGYRDCRESYLKAGYIEGPPPTISHPALPSVIQAPAPPR
jgi:hypothetical protein